jgi:uncharacterized protein (TIGR00369 family)
MTTYPPPHHLLRDLRFGFDHAADDRTSRAWLPVVPELCSDAGQPRAGALATLVDVIGGGLAARAADPDWIATADLTLHLVGGAPPGSVVEARAEVLRAGRTTVVIEVGLTVAETARPVGIATMSFAVLARRDANPDAASIRAAGPTTMAEPGSGLRLPLLDELGVEVRDPAAGVLDVPVTDWARNSMGAMQGGVVATIAEAAAETALRAASGEPLVATDLHLTYLGFGRVGPVTSSAEVLRTAPGFGIAHVELSDRGAEHRLMTTARVVASRPLPA